MNHGTFVWTDLSSYRPRTARGDYKRLFDWRFEGMGAYKFAMRGGVPVAAVFPMPKPLAKINMPSFWMSYVRVDDLDGAVEKARGHEGVIIEVEPQAFDEKARVALVRDPSGAGFTLYEGPEIGQAGTGASQAGRVIARYHHVPELGLIERFYRDLFGWSFKRVTETPWPVFKVVRPDGGIVAHVEEVPEEIRDKFRYWMPCFGVADLTAFVAQLERRGGVVLNDLGDGRLLVADRQGASFMVRSVG